MKVGRENLHLHREGVNMQFRALGDLEVRDGDERIDLGARKQQALFAMLLAHANEVVSTDRLLEHLWGDDADGKENALWVYVSRLRSALEPDRVERGESTVLLRRSPGYLLAVEDAEYDVAQFEQLVHEGRSKVGSDPAGASEALGRALALWRGPAFDGFDDEPALRGMITRLTELRVDATEDRIDADLARGRAGELVSEIESLREQHPWRERPVEQLMLSLYRSGRPAEALRAFERFRRMIGEELGIDPSPELRRLEEQILLHDDTLQPRSRSDGPAGDLHAQAANPYKGLRAFVEDDAADFFGRSSLIADMVRVMSSGQKLIAVVGASGSGKSSVVRAGLLPALAKGAIPGSDEWQVSYMVPGAYPFAELEAALLRSTINGPDSLDEQLRIGNDGLLRAALRVLPASDSHLVLVIDQFEELFTLVDDEAVRARFLSNLVTVLDDPRGRVTIVLTLRADFYGRPLRHPQFGARLSGSVINVTPLTPEELGAAAIEPAKQVGIDLEPALLAELTHDVGSETGPLPLFQYALTELFDSRRGSTLLVEGYRAMGGLSGALSRQAGHLYEQLNDDERAAARQLFLRLVTVSDSDQHSRRRVAASEIVSLGIDTALIQRVIGLFGERRLLSFDADRLTGSPTVEIAHEAMLTAWPQFETWIAESQHDLRRHASLTVAMREWQLADRHPDYLLTSARLAEFDDWSQTTTMALTETEVEFLSRALALQNEELERAQVQQQADARARRRLWGLIAALTATLGVAALFLFGVIGGGTQKTVAFFGHRVDEGWNANIAAGLDRAAQRFDLDLVDAPPIVDPATEFRELAETGPDLIISDALPTYTAPEVFAEFPDIQFGLVDASFDAPNVATVRFANEEGAFLMGAAAAMTTETGVVGFIGGVPGIIDDFRAGFEAGTHWVDPEVEVLATYVAQPFMDEHGLVGGFVDPRLGADRADSLYELGADVVFHAAGLSGLGLFDSVVRQSEAAGTDLWAIGVDNDQWFTVEPAQRPFVLTSMIKRGDTAAFLLTEAMVEGEIADVNLNVGLADDALSYSTQGDGLTDDMIATLERIRAGIVDGSIIVPTEPVGPFLNLDEAANLFEARFSQLSDEEFGMFFDTWIFPDREAEIDSHCETRESTDDDMECTQYLVGELDLWLAQR